MPPTSVTTPPMSIRRSAPSSQDSGVHFHIKANATMPIGRLIQKIHCHDK